MPAMKPASHSIGEYLAAHGGPFYQLQLRLGLLRENALHAGRRSLIFIAITWLVPLLISVLEGHAVGPPDESPFLLDLAVWARFFVAVGAFIYVEKVVEKQLRLALQHFMQAPLIASSSIEAAAAAVAAALRRRNSVVAEGICLVLAAVASLVAFVNVSSLGVASWAIDQSAQGASLTLAAWWCLLVSSPIFWFLLFRGLWRHFVWSLLLRRLAALEFRLVAAHPDRHGGLGFIGHYPNVYSLFIFGISCVVGAIIARQLTEEAMTMTAYGSIMGAWLAIVMALFAYPLMAFSKPLLELKQKALLTAGAQATRFYRLTERKVLGANIMTPDATEAEQTTDVNDPSKQFETAQKLSAFLIDRSALVPIAAAALLPLAAAGATKLPYKEILSVVKKLLLL